MKKNFIIFGILILGLFGILVSANSFITTQYTVGEAVSGYKGIRTGYIVTYDIKNPGWYLLPNINSVVSLSTETGDFQAYYKSIDYQYAFSPFSKKYLRCNRKPNQNHIWCNDFEKIYDESESYLNSLPDVNLTRDYLSYLGVLADWHYYSKPTKVVYQYSPDMFVNRERDEIDLMDTKLKSGWNLIIYPAYLGYGFIELGDCIIEKAYMFDDEKQQWDFISNYDFINKDYSGSGMAIQVVEDCTFLKEK